MTSIEPIFLNLESLYSIKGIECTGEEILNALIDNTIFKEYFQREGDEV